MRDAPAHPRAHCYVQTDPATGFQSWATKHRKAYVAPSTNAALTAHPAYQAWLDNAQWAARYNEEHSSTGHWVSQGCKPALPEAAHGARGHPRQSTVTAPAAKHTVAK